MIPILKRFLHDLFYSTERATLWFRGITTWLGVAAGLVVAYPPEIIAKWTLKEWGLRWLIASVSALSVMKKAGEKNRTDDQIRQVVGDQPVALPLTPPQPNPPPMS